MQNASTSYANVANVYSLTKESIQKDLDSALLQLQNSQTSRENTYKTTDEQLKLANTQLANINTTDKNTKETSSIAIDLAKKSLQTAKLNLENTYEIVNPDLSVETKKL
jgi:hypothetical protein